MTHRNQKQCVTCIIQLLICGSGGLDSDKAFINPDSLAFVLHISSLLRKCGIKIKTSETSRRLNELNIQVFSWKHVDQAKCVYEQKFMLITP